MTHILAAALVLHLSNFSGAPAAIVQAAQDEVTRVYTDIGVPLAWSAASAGRDDDQPAIHIILLPYESGDLRHTDKQVMGAATRTPAGNRVAYVFYHRIRAEAARYDVSTGLVLACAISHELGHLLLPVRSHAAAGLMRASWSRDEFRRAGRRQLTFLPQEVAWIREGIR